MYVLLTQPIYGDEFTYYLHFLKGGMCKHNISNIKKTKKKFIEKVYYPEEWLLKYDYYSKIP